MNVFAVDDGQPMLGLVAHFLGIATHDNVNAAPSAAAVLRAPVRKLVLSSDNEQLLQRPRQSL